MDYRISPSLMCMDIWNLKEQIGFLNKKAFMYHVDIFDGVYVKNICLSPGFIKMLSSKTDVPIDAHLCITRPSDFIEEVAAAGAAYISIHADVILKDAFRYIELVKRSGCKLGVVLNPSIPLSFISPYIRHIDKLTIMTIEPGFAGQNLIPETLEKIKQAKMMKQESGYPYLLEVDGQCNQKNFKTFADAGIEVFIVGTSGLFGLNENIENAWEIMQDYMLAAK